MADKVKAFQGLICDLASESGVECFRAVTLKELLLTLGIEKMIKIHYRGKVD